MDDPISLKISDVRNEHRYGNSIENHLEHFVVFNDDYISLKQRRSFVVGGHVQNTKRAVGYVRVVRLMLVIIWDYTFFRNLIFQISNSHYIILWWFCAHNIFQHKIIIGKKLVCAVITYGQLVAHDLASPARVTAAGLAKSCATCCHM